MASLTEASTSEDSWKPTPLEMYLLPIVGLLVLLLMVVGAALLVRLRRDKTGYSQGSNTGSDCGDRKKGAIVGGKLCTFTCLAGGFL